MSQNHDTYEAHNFSKWFLFLFLFSSISFVFFSAFSNQSRVWFVRCPVCDSTTPTTTLQSHHHISNEYPEKDEPTPTNISHIVFGIGGSVTTWRNRKHYSELWWKPNVTRGCVWLDKELDNRDTDGNSTSPPYRVSSDTSTLKGRWRSSIRISRIVTESYRLGLPDVRWFVMGDDDTVFFPENLVTVLSRYDHSEMYYIGGNSESVEQNVMHSYGMAFGGGGFAISYPLAVELDKLLDGCIDRYESFYGSDQRVWACLHEIGVPLTTNPGFHQIDVHGNLYGLLAAHPLTPLVSLHHLDAVTPLFPDKTRLDSLRLLLGAYKVDPGRTLQQSFCYDYEKNYSISVSWGYTVQVYPSLLTAWMLQTAVQTFNTWRSWSSGPFTFNTRPMSSVACERPFVYFLDRVDEFPYGETLTSYKRFVGETGFDCDRATQVAHRINVLTTRMEPNEWGKAPRRQCCEMVNRIDGVQSVVHLRMRKCKPWESVSVRN